MSSFGVVGYFEWGRRLFDEKPQVNTNKNYTWLDPNRTVVKLGSI